MKVTGVGNVSGAPPRRSAAKDGGAGFQVDAAPIQDAGGPTATAPLASLDALIALQSDAGGAAGHGDRPARDRAARLLDILDDLRDGLLVGAIPGHRLATLQSALASERASAADPGLQSLLDDIDLRAQVELAKLEQARAASGRR